jgi:thiosulfate reductase / polysulfide reductase chain A
MFSRRNFLKLGTAVAAVAPIATGPKAHAQETARMEAGGKDYSPLTGTERAPIATACALCASRCAAMAYEEHGYVVKIEGNPNSQRTLGKLCAKGQAGINQIYDPDRILHPLRRTGKRGEGKWEKISWDTALGELSSRLKKLRDAGTPEKFMFHHGWISASADKLINNVFLKTYGTGTIADNSCLGQGARRIAHKLTWGGSYDNWDFDHTRFILNFGSNVMEADINHIALASRLASALTNRNLKMVTFDVRLSNTAAKSNDWIQIKPGTDAAVILAMCNVVMAKRLYTGPGESFLEFCQVTPNANASIEDKIAALTSHLKTYTPEWAEEISGVSAKQIRDIAIEFAKARPAVIISSRGASAHYNGVETERAVQMLAAITGNIDTPGGRCLGTVPQWSYPTGPEDKPVTKKLDILDGIEGHAALPILGASHQVLRMIKDGRAGRPEVYMWYNYNPVISNGNVGENLEVLKDEKLIPYSVAVTPFYDESAALADLILPDATYLEAYDFEDGVSPTQIPEYYIRQPVVPPQGDARDFKDVCCDLAERMEMPLGFESAEEFVTQSCDLTKNISEKAGGFSGMTEQGVWQDPEAKPAYHSYRQIVNPNTLQTDGVLLDDETGVYWSWKSVGLKNEQEAKRNGYQNTPNAYKGYIGQMIWGTVYDGFKPDGINKSGYFELYSPILKSKSLPPMPTYTAIPEHKTKKANELVLTTFRINVQTSTKTQNSPWLDEISDDTSCWINPKSAKSNGLKDGGNIKIKSAIGEIETTVRVTEAVVPGVIAIPSHGGRWEYGRYASGQKSPYSIEKDSPREDLKWWDYKGGHINRVIDNISDPIGGQQRWMDTVVTVKKA